MSANESLISKAFQTFLKDAPKHSEAWMNLVKGLASANALEPKTRTLAYIAVLAALRMESGIPFHVKEAKNLGATRDEIISAVLVGLPAAGHVVTQSLPSAVETFDTN